MIYLLEIAEINLLSKILLGTPRFRTYSEETNTIGKNGKDIQRNEKFRPMPAVHADRSDNIHFGERKHGYKFPKLKSQHLTQ